MKKNLLAKYTVRGRGHSLNWRSHQPDMEFVQNFTPPDFQAKNFTPSISPNFNSLVRKTQKMSENGEIYTTGKNFTLPDFRAKNFTPSISSNFNSFG